MDHLAGLLPHLATLHLIWGALLFAGIAAWAYRPSRKRLTEEQAAIPLRDDR
jgi:cbb3-type cytochrome oxidase subunit 3